MRRPGPVCGRGPGKTLQLRVCISQSHFFLCGRRFPCFRSPLFLGWCPTVEARVFFLPPSGYPSFAPADSMVAGDLHPSQSERMACPISNGISVCLWTCHASISAVHWAVERLGRQNDASSSRPDSWSRCICLVRVGRKPQTCSPEVSVLPLNRFELFQLLSVWALLPTRARRERAGWFRGPVHIGWCLDTTLLAGKGARALAQSKPIIIPSETKGKEQGRLFYQR